ncbi:MAG: glutaredoxin domain-containing protein [Cyanobacteriota bacterium]|nr:glutaredoxin domain-containing protein [Cyanobacteriota bacterium]
MATPALHAVRLYRIDLPDHPCPWGLRALRLLQEQRIPYDDHRLTSNEELEAFKRTYGVATTPQIFSGTERIGGYTELAATLGVRPETADNSYAPVLAVFVTAGLIALFQNAGVRGFMGMAICLLAMLKLMDVQAFAASFRKYDLLSQRCRPSSAVRNRWWERWLCGSGRWEWCRWARRCSSITWPSTAPAWAAIPKRPSAW